MSFTAAVKYWKKTESGAMRRFLHVAELAESAVLRREVKDVIASQLQGEGRLIAPEFFIHNENKNRVAWNLILHSPYRESDSTETLNLGLSMNLSLK